MATGRLTLSPILILNPELRDKYIYPNFSTNEMCLFARTCDTAENETSPSRVLHCAAHALPKSYKQKDKTKLAATGILLRHLDLLFKNGYVTDPAGHLIYGSVYKIFLGAGDICALKMVHDKIIPLIENGEAIAEEQYKEQFPNHAVGSIYDDRNIAQIAEIEKDLKELAAAILDDPCTDGKATKQRTINAINNLRVHLAPKEGEVISSGLHSPPEILCMIHKLCLQYCYDWSSDQCTFYSNQAIASGEAVAAPVEAQRYKNGSSKYINENTPPDRTISYYEKGGIPDGLGDSCFIDLYSGERGSKRERNVGEIRDAISVMKVLEKLCQEKKSALVAIMQRWQHPDQNIEQVRSLNMDTY